MNLIESRAEVIRAEARDLINTVWHDSDDEGEVEEIEHFKYKQELSRKLSIGSVLGLSISVMSVPLGISTTMIVGLMNGGGATIFWGWILVSVLSLLVTTSLGEMAGKYPTNGGVYHWLYIFAPRKVQRLQEFNTLTSWFVGWFLIIGNITMAISISFSGAQFFLSIFGISDTTYHPHSYITLLVFYLIVLCCLVINLQWSQYLDTINRVSIYWTVSTVIIIDVLLLLFSTQFNDLRTVLSTFETPRSGWPAGLAFLIGLQQSGFTFQGYGMIPSMTDEVKTPERTIPKGMMYSVVVAGVTGIVFILPILACTPELDSLLDIESNILPIELIFLASSKSLVISSLFVILLCGTIFFGSIGIYTISSRSIFSFARDNGLPYSHLWTSVNSDLASTKIPNNAIYLTAGWLVAMGLLTLVSPTILYSYMGMSVLSLSAANLIPIVLSLVNRRKKLKGSTFRIKKFFGYIVNGASILWCFLLMFIFSCPIQANFNSLTMNYTSVLFILEVIFIVISWLAFGKSHFHGPEIDESYSVENSQGYQLAPMEDTELPQQDLGAPVSDTENGDRDLLGDTPNLMFNTPNVPEDELDLDSVDEDKNDSLQDPFYQSPLNQSEIDIGVNEERVHSNISINK